jgi:hypothetical protein
MKKKKGSPNKTWEKIEMVNVLFPEVISREQGPLKKQAKHVFARKSTVLWSLQGRFYSRRAPSERCVHG